MDEGNFKRKKEVTALAGQFQRPDLPAMDNLEGLIKRIYETEEILRTLRMQREGIIKELANQIKDENKRLCVINYLYWMVPEITMSSIAKAFLGDGKKEWELKSFIQPFKLNFYCERCGKQFRFSTRSEKERGMAKEYGLKQRASEQPPDGRARLSQCDRKRQYWENLFSISELVCDHCHDNIIDERMDRHFERQAMWEAKRKERLKELRSMPYREYLKTPEWMRRRYYHLRSTGHHCQVCNASAKQKRLNVHHRKYTTLGNEAFTDLIVLCEDCHELFHHEGKLAQESA